MRLKIGGGKVAERPDHVESWARGENPGPLTIEVGATYGCNQHCLHCGFQQFQPYGNDRHYMRTEAFKSFLEDFRELGGVEVYFAGNGEPLLNPEIPAWVAHGDSLGLNMTMSSNGVLLTARKIAALLPHMTWIRFSVNGGDQASYTRVHDCRPEEFSIVVSNLETAVRFRNEHRLKAKLILQCIVYDLNWQSIAQLVEIHRRIGTDWLIFRNVVNADGAIADPLPEAIDHLKQVAKDENVDVRWDTFLPPEKKPVWSKCYGINFRTNMDDKGNLITCNRHLVVDSVYGNIHEQRFRDIWASVNKQRVFAEVEQGFERSRCERWCQTSYDNATLDEYLKKVSRDVLASREALNDNAALDEYLKKGSPIA